MKKKSGSGWEERGKERRKEPKGSRKRERRGSGRRGKGRGRGFVSGFQRIMPHVQRATDQGSRGGIL